MLYSKYICIPPKKLNIYICLFILNHIRPRLQIMSKSTPTLSSTIIKHKHIPVFEELSKIGVVRKPYVISQKPPPITINEEHASKIKVLLRKHRNKNSNATQVNDPPQYPPVIKTYRKRRTQEEINAEKQLKAILREEKRLATLKRIEAQNKLKAAKTLLKLHLPPPLVHGTTDNALAAMWIIESCKRNMQNVNNAFRQMIASRIIFPPKKNINKFATGGIAEECITQLFQTVGIDCKNVSDETTLIDLEIHANVDNRVIPFNVSLKNSGNLKSSIILENYRGQKRMEIRPLPPTFIVYTEMVEKRVRIVYLDEEILRQGYPNLSKEESNAEIYINNDSNLAFKSGFLLKFIPRLPAEYILNAEYPDNLSGLEECNFSKLALIEVVRQLVGDSITKNKKRE